MSANNESFGDEDELQSEEMERHERIEQDKAEEF